jgi:hypothetical protein
MMSQYRALSKSRGGDLLVKTLLIITAMRVPRSKAVMNTWEICFSTSRKQTD